MSPEYLPRTPYLLYALFCIHNRPNRPFKDGIKPPFYFKGKDIGAEKMLHGLIDSHKDMLALEMLENSDKYTI